MLVLVLLALLALLAPGAAVAVTRAGKARNGHRKPSIAVLLYDFESCEGVSPNNIQVKNFTTVREKSGMAFYNADIFFAKGLKKISKLEMRTTQCNDGVSFNTCFYAQTLTFTTAVCPLMVSDLMPWSTVVRAMHPTFRCPVDAGKYELRNGTVNIAGLENMAGPAMSDILGKIFMTDIRLFDEKNQLHSCLKLKASFINTRG